MSALREEGCPHLHLTPVAQQLATPSFHILLPILMLYYLVLNGVHSDWAQGQMFTIASLLPMQQTYGIKGLTLIIMVQVMRHIQDLEFWIAHNKSRQLNQSKGGGM